jgi:DNA replication and repair protein RecF
LLIRLSGRGFRNLEPFDWRPAKGNNVILGPNGAGKTSLIEALYTLATTRSFRSSRLAVCVRHGESGLDLRGEVEGAARTALSLSWDERGLQRAVNDAAVGWAEHLEVLPVVLWWSGAQETVTGAPRLRRRMLDQGVVGLHPAALQATARFRRVLRQKRELLARGDKGLSSWNEVFAQSASEVTRLRARYTEVLSRELEELLRERGEDPQSIRLSYRPSLQASLNGPENAVAALESVRTRELEQAQAVVGPHRDELSITWRGHPVSDEASAGETKWIGLTLAAARGRVLAAQGREPVYLLDDLDAELDAGRLERALELFSGAAQIAATSSREEAWNGAVTTSVWRLDEGRIQS